MMEKIGLGVLFLTDCLILSSCLIHQLHFIQQEATWIEAQKYCRQKYTDLATIKNFEEIDQVTKGLASAVILSDSWIGLYSVVDWKWSNGFNGSGADYRKWAAYDEDPDFFDADQFCVCTNPNGYWFDDYCTLEYPFICYNGTQLNPEFVLVNEPMNWSNAKKHCRDNFVDLATVRNSLENNKFQNLVPKGNSAWNGLFRDPNFYWSDGSSFLFSYFDSGSNRIYSLTTICGIMPSKSPNKWKFKSCETKLPFVCYSAPPEVKHRVQLSLTAEDSDDAINPVLKTKLQEKLQDRLEENGKTSIKLEWA